MSEHSISFRGETWKTLQMMHNRNDLNKEQKLNIIERAPRQQTTHTETTRPLKAPVTSKDGYIMFHPPLMPETFLSLGRQDAVHNPKGWSYQTGNEKKASGL